MFQQPRLFSNLTVKENLLLALSSEDQKFWKSFLGLQSDSKSDEEKVIEALKLVGMDHFKDKIASEMSFGQKRLVELARAIIKPHKLLMLDEPVGGVTPPTRNKIAEILGQIRSNDGTVFLIEHDMNFVLNLADEVIVLDEGKVIAKGKPSQIKKNKKVLEAYLGE